MLQCLVTKDNRTVTNLRPEGPSPSTIKHLETMRGVQGCAEREAPRKSCDLYQVTQGRMAPRRHNGKESTRQYRRCKRHRFHPWVRKIPRVGTGNPPLYSHLENSMERAAW